MKNDETNACKPLKLQLKFYYRMQTIRLNLTSQATCINPVTNKGEISENFSTARRDTEIILNACMY